ncbi:MAG: hypothetical protein NVS3B10_24170 [Polyangiales bacterium]
MTATTHQRKGLTLDRLRSFLDVADAGGHARAAKGDLVRQSQLCRQVGDLERYFGQALTERRGQALVITEAGQRLATLARDIFKGLDDLASPAHRADQAVRLDLGAGDSVLQWWVLPRIASALARLPGVTLSLTSLSSVDVVRRLDEGSLDLGIVRAGDVAKGRGIESRPLVSLEYAVFVRRTRMTQARAHTLEDVLAKVPLAGQQSEPVLNECLRPFLRGAALSFALGCETFPQACRAVRSGEYAALLPVMARAELPEREYAELQPPGFKKLAAKMVLAWHPRLVRQRRRGAEIVEGLGRGLKA